MRKDDKFSIPNATNRKASRITSVVTKDIAVVSTQVATPGSGRIAFCTTPPETVGAHGVEYVCIFNAGAIFAVGVPISGFPEIRMVKTIVMSQFVSEDPEIEFAVNPYHRRAYY